MDDLELIIAALRDEGNALALRGPNWIPNLKRLAHRIDVMREQREKKDANAGP